METRGDYLTELMVISCVKTVDELSSSPSLSLSIELSTPLSRVDRIAMRNKDRMRAVLDFRRDFILAKSRYELWLSVQMIGRTRVDVSLHAYTTFKRSVQRRLDDTAKLQLASQPAWLIGKRSELAWHLNGRTFS